MGISIRSVGTRYVIADTAIHTTVEDEVLILNVNTGTYFGLDGVGRRVWELLSDGMAEESIVDVLCRDYEVGADELAADVHDLILMLLARGLAIKASE